MRAYPLGGESGSTGAVMIEFEQFLAKSTRGAERSIIRELLKMAGGKVISFAGGRPDPATLPVGGIRQVLLDVLSTSASRALQYGTTEGDVRLRDELVKW